MVRRCIAGAGCPCFCSLEEPKLEPNESWSSSSRKWGPYPAAQNYSCMLVSYHLKTELSLKDSTTFERQGKQYNDRVGRSVEWETAVTGTEYTVLSLF
jgi:hypothetical protein